MKRPIAIGLSPNTQKDDVRLAFRLLCMPWIYIHGNASKELERWFRVFCKTSYAVSFINARSALYAILHCMEIAKGDEVLLQAFTCVAVPNAVIATGAIPVYVDIDATVNIDPLSLEKKITKKTKALIVQHTFGIPADMDAIMRIAKKYKIAVIEDCAHTIGGEYKGQKLGTFGIAACYSFGRDKAFSSVFGGMAITSDAYLGRKLRSYQKQRNFPSYFWVGKQLLYPILSSIILHWYYVFSLGRSLHFLLRKIHFFSEPVTQKEKQGEVNLREVKRFPNALATLALLQVKKIKEYNQTRIDMASLYVETHCNASLQGKSEITFDTKTPLLRFPIVVSDKQAVLTYFAKRGIYIGNWASQVIAPAGVNLEKIQYTSGSCPSAEGLSQTVIELPTYPTMTLSDAEKVVKVFKQYAADSRNN